MGAAVGSQSARMRLNALNEAPSSILARARSPRANAVAEETADSLRGLLDSLPAWHANGAPLPHHARTHVRRRRRAVQATRRQGVQVAHGRASMRTVPRLVHRAHAIHHLHAATRARHRSNQSVHARTRPPRRHPARAAGAGPGRRPPRARWQGTGGRGGHRSHGGARERGADHDGGAARARGEHGAHARRLHAADAACPLSTRGGTRLVRLVRGRGASWPAEAQARVSAGGREEGREGVGEREKCDEYTVGTLVGATVGRGVV